MAAVQACVTNGAVELAVPLIERFKGLHSDNAQLWYWSGRALEQEGRQAEAAAAWVRASQLAPRDSRLQLDVGICEVGSQKPDVVARGVQRLEGLRRDPDGGIRSAAVSALVDHAMLSDPRAAATIWDRYLAENPGDRGAAISHLKVLARADPGSVPARVSALWANAANLEQKLELVSAVAKINGPEAGFGLIERLSAREKLEAKALVLRLELLAGMGRWSEVVETAEVSAESRSLYGVDEQISVWGWLGVARFSLADVAGFQAACRALEALVGTNADRAMRVGDWLASRGFDFEAAGFFRTASRPNSPRRYAALLALDKLYGRTGDRQKRLLACEQLLQLDSENPAVQSELACVLLELGWDRERALKLAREAWERNRASYEFMDTYAHALAMNGLAGDGVALYEQMPPEFLGRDTVRLNYVESLMSAGRFADARLQLIQVKHDRLPRAIQSRRDRIEIELRAR
jgi:tetratricopeptide (TPR) repeat protein